MRTLDIKIIRVKKLLLFLLVSISCFPALAQKTVEMKNLWARPQVHVMFEGYSVSFTIRDINRALELMRETGDSTFGSDCKLDTAGNFFVDLLSGNHMEYHNSLQILMQQGVGAYLLSMGHGYIENPKHKRVTAVTMNIIPPAADEPVAYLVFYDPKTGDRVFTGSMKVAMYNKDLGIDYW